MSRDDQHPIDPVDEALSDALAKHVPRHRPSAGFEARLRARLDAAAPPVDAAKPAPPSRFTALFVGLTSGLAGAAVVAAVMVSTARPPSAPAPRQASGWTLADEVVSDHLRVVAGTRPPEVESGGIHQVKPWFTGRVDFAPRVAFAGDPDFPLVGGSLGYVRDRKAAVFQYRRRLHAITLLVFPGTDLPWPEGATSLAGRSVHEETSRGFSVLLWRDGDLAYALVSDVARAELETLVPKISPPQ
jgi:anti-sigma factor RsiW